MSSSQGINIPITAEDEFSEAFSQLESDLSEASNSMREFNSSSQEFASSSATTTTAAGSVFSTQNNSISTLSTANSDLVSSQGELIDSTNALGESQIAVAEESAALASETEATSSSFRNGISSVMGLAGAFSATAFGAISLGDAQIRLQDSTLRVENAQDNLHKAQDTVTQDQIKLADAQDKLRQLQDSGRATASQLAAAQLAVSNASNTLQNAQLGLQNAQDNLTAAQNRQRLALEQEYLGYAQLGLSILPLVRELPELGVQLGLVAGEEDALTIAQMAQAAASGVASGAMAILDAVMDANPIFLVVAAIGALVAVLAYVTDGFKNWTPVVNFFKQAWSDMQDAFNDFVGFIKKDVFPVLDTLFNIFIKPIIDGIQTIEKIGSAMGGGLSQIGKDIGSVIPGLAEGGVVSRPTLAVVGESGPEAVVPLGQFGMGSNGPSSSLVSDLGLGTNAVSSNNNTTITTSSTAPHKTVRNMFNFYVDTVKVDASSQEMEELVQKNLSRVADSLDLGY